MTDVFISYRSTQLPLARVVADQLSKRGLNVWYDDALRAGSDYRAQIAEALRRADVVLVLWTEDAVTSPWVNDEARQGLGRGRLLSVQVDSAQPAASFRGTIAYRLRTGERRSMQKSLTKLADIVASGLATVRRSDARFAEVSSATISARLLDLSGTLLVGFLLYFPALFFSFDFERLYDTTDGRAIAMPPILLVPIAILIAVIQSPFAILGGWIFDAIGKQFLRLNLGPSNKRIAFRWVGEAVGWSAPWWALFGVWADRILQSEELQGFGPWALVVSAIFIWLVYMVGLLPKILPFFFVRSLRSGLLR